MSSPHRLPANIRWVRRGALVAAVLGAALCWLGYRTAPDWFFQAYLLAFLTVWSVCLGSLAVLMIHHLVGGRWGSVSRRALEAGACPLLWLPLVAIPLDAGIETLYPWSHAETTTHPLPEDKAAYLNVPLFRARAIAYLAIWAVTAGLLCGLSPKADAERAGAACRQRRLRGISGFGLLIYGLSVTLAGVDWMMSLEPHWYSAMYGVTLMAGQGVAGFSLAIVMLASMHHDPRVRSASSPDVFHDLGNLLLASVAFWMYITFSQYLIIWSGNLPEEITWYLARSTAGWKLVAALLIGLHFVVPLVLLLSPRVKRSPAQLGAVAAALLAAHALDIYWLVMPALRAEAGVHWLDVVALLTLTAAMLTVALTWIARRGPIFLDIAATQQEPESESLGHAPSVD